MVVTNAEQTGTEVAGSSAASLGGSKRDFSHGSSSCATFLFGTISSSERVHASPDFIDW